MHEKSFKIGKKGDELRFSTYPLTMYGIKAEKHFYFFKSKCFNLKTILYLYYYKIELTYIDNVMLTNKITDEKNVLRLGPGTVAYTYILCIRKKFLFKYLHIKRINNKT